MNNFFNGMFGKIGANMCKLSMNGDIAIKTSSGYKTFDANTNKLTNCDNFVFGMGDMECFFLIPTNKVEKGDIIIANGQPKCVITVKENSIECLNFETSVIETILPENHIFMGNTYFYGKIVSMFGNLKNGGSEKILKYMIMSEMMKSTNGANNNWMPMMFMMGDNKFNIFENLFDNTINNTINDTTEKETK